MYNDLINIMKNVPAAYDTTEIAFWDDEHISKSMLENHLAPEGEGASRRHEFIQKSVDWIDSLSASKGKLLDLGCGPGIYADLLYDKGYDVTGIDFSKRSIAYAQQAADHSGKRLNYIYQDYLTINYSSEFNLAIMIYCDLGVLSPDLRETLLAKIYTALKPGGLFIVDAFTPKQYETFTDNLAVTFEMAGFWQPVPHLCIKRDKRYDDHVFLEQYTVLTDEAHQVYNLWNHAFTKPELARALQKAGFADVKFYGDAAGSSFNQRNSTICAVARKKT